jgi:hypothetical protein
MRRTLFTAGVFALLAMAYVPTPHQGYRLIFSQRDTSIAFFQLLVNVVFAALLGAILATIIPKIVTGVRRLPKWVWRGIGGIALIALFSVGAVAWWKFTEAAQRDERYANELFRGRHDVFNQAVAEFYFRNAARNWRLALRFSEARRVENRIKETEARPPPWPKKYISTDPNAGQMPPPTQGELPAITVNSGELNLPIEIRLVCVQEGQDPFAWLSITRHNKEQERYFEPYHTKMVSMYMPVVKNLGDGTYEVTFTEGRP